MNWAGFYVAEPAASSSKSGTEQLLLLGPFQGKVACQVIRVGKGVCGAAAEQQRTVLVKDVDEFPGHIACDGESRSEIVVPILKGDKVSTFPSLCSSVRTRRNSVIIARFGRLIREHTVRWCHRY